MKNFPKQLRHGSGAEMTLEPNRLLIGFKTPQPEDALTNALQRLELVLETARTAESDANIPWQEVINQTDKRFWVSTASGQPIDDALIQRIEKQFGKDLEFTSPVYRIPNVRGRGGLVSPLSHVLLIRTPAARGETDGIASVAKQFGLQEDEEKSRYLGEFRYFTVSKPRENNAYQLREVMAAQLAKAAADVRFENMPMLVPVTAIAPPAVGDGTAVTIPITAVPNDPLFAQQWDMTQINAVGAWDISTGTGTIVGVLDTGVDQTHPDISLAAPGVNLGTMTPPGSPAGPSSVMGHGTCCAGIAAAVFNNSQGIAGVAGGAQVLPIAFQNWTDVECAAGINFAAANGARALSMSFGVYAPGDGFGPTGWDFTIIDPAIANAVNVVGVVLCAATGNENTGTINRYPARNPLVIACGGSDQSDNRKRPASPDGECWGANFGPGISVAAPAVLCPATDMQGTNGFNDNSGGPKTVACVTYPSSGDAAGDYFLEFNGTSSATPHVAGLATLLAGAYPALSNTQIRSVIEHTADKVGVNPYADVPGFPNGTRTAELGYGRIDCFHALDYAGAMIRDWSGDNGVEPSTPPGGDFWDYSDMVVRPTDDGVFLPSAIALSNVVTRGQTNYIYVRVVNNGPRDARNVIVNVRITPYVGLQFIYPGDWTAVDANHVAPTAVTNTFTTIGAGASAMAKFTVSSTQVDQLWGWISGSGWHPCMLAQVSADNDYGFASSAPGSNLVVLRKNLAQRNLTVIPTSAASTIAFPIVAGHIADLQTSMRLVIDRSMLPKTMSVVLSLENAAKYFPNLELPAVLPANDSEEMEDDLIFLERTRLETRIGCCRGVLVVEKGSRFTALASNGQNELEVTHVEGGRLVLEGKTRSIEVTEETAKIDIRKRPGQLYPLSLHFRIPQNAVKGDEFLIRVAQQNEQGLTVGGATAAYIVE